jgi:serine phosphatase RsbU (regulator of sigma subunit)
VVLPPGTTFVLFTDGLVERRDEDLAVSLRHLADRAALLDTEPDRLLDGLLDALVPDESDDDVAILAFRLVGPDRAQAARAAV